jgi:ribokinase
MKIINFGSLNIDHVYQVDHIVLPGETIAGSSHSLHAGGKGANQSVAIARAGGKVSHAGKIGSDGLWMIDRMKADGIDVSHVMIGDSATGHAIIQVDGKGQNAIVVFGGTNRMISGDEIDDVLTRAMPDDSILLQNEINNIPYIMEQAAKRKLPISFNPAPMGPEVFDYPLGAVSTFFVNNSEGEALTGEKDPEAILSHMQTRYPDALVILTLGSKGSLYAKGSHRETILAPSVNAVDTTGAGDTFIGYFCACMQRGMALKDSLVAATKAASICVTRKGATTSIPVIKEVL